MRRILTQTKNIILVFLLLSFGNVFAQTKTKYETAVISTGHASLSAEIIKNGSALEVWVKNNHPTKTYKVNFTANVRLGGTKGEFNETFSTSVKLKPNADGFAISYIGEADPSKNLYLSLLGGKFDNFTWTEVNDTKNTETTNSATNTNNSYQANDNATTNETSYNTNPQVKQAVERQNRLKTIQEQQKEQQKEQQNANYEKAMAFEQQRQESIKQTNETISAVTGVITDYIYQKAEERRKEREEEEERLEREYEQRMAEHERKVALEAKINNRKTALAEFPAKDIPLGSQEKAGSIYYFIYAYDNSINNENGANVYISNVFVIDKFNDGTRAYTSTVKKEIETLTPFAEILHGYYYTQQNAEQLRQTLLSILQNNGVTIKEVNYKGKPFSKNATKQEDFWGETQNDQKFAPAKINTAKPRELPKETQKQEEKKKKDFWD